MTTLLKQAASFQARLQEMHCTAEDQATPHSSYLPMYFLTASAAVPKAEGRSCQPDRGHFNVERPPTGNSAHFWVPGL
jgi:hypothetical protein